MGRPPGLRRALSPPRSVPTAEPTGPLICAPCHPAETKGHAATQMAHAMEPGIRSRILQTRPEVTHTIGPYRYQIRRDGDHYSYTVTDGAGTISAPIQWLVGQGAAGQTYLLERDGKLYESWVSYYNALEGLGVTMGAPQGTPKTLAEAFGREMRPQEVTDCFACHSSPRPGAPSVPKGTLEWTRTLEVGVQCENCHAGAFRHAAARKQGDLATGRLRHLKSATTEELSDVCGACHRTWDFIQINGPRGVGNVRFQPYRIALSKCYDAVDRRIGCTACHDPHTRPDKAIAGYDSACKACHRPAAGTQKSIQLCKVSQNDCATCHMPKYELSTAHFRFTDHFIRIVRPHEEYPD